jgi:hypothetical protein
MTKFELYGENFIVDGDKIKSKRKDINTLLQAFALVNKGQANFSAELLMVSAAVSLGAVVTSGAYLSYLQNPPDTVY